MNKIRNDFIVHADSNQRISYANQAYCDAFGITENDIVGYDFKRLIHPEDINRVRDSLELLKVPPHMTHHEERAKTVHGWRWIAWTVKADIDVSGNVSGIKAIGTDVTEVKQEQKELLQKKNQIEKVLKVGELVSRELELKSVLKNILKGTVDALNASIGMIFLKDTSTVYLSWGASVGLSDAFINSFRKQPIQIGEGLSGRIAQTGKPIYIQADSSHDPRIARGVVRDEKLNSFIGVPIFASEQIVGVMNVLTRPPDILSENDLSLCAAIGTNVGMAVKNARLYEEKVTVEKALKKSEKKYRHLVEYAPSGLYEIDFINNKFTTVNDVACEYTGYTKQELLGMEPANLLTPKSAHEFFERLQRMSAGKKVPPKVEYQIQKKDGDTLWAELSVQLIYQGEEIKGATVVAHDITDRKRAEDKLRKNEAQKQAILDSSVDSIRLVDRDMKIIWTNKIVENLINRKRKDIVGEYCYRAFTGRNEPCPDCPTEKSMKSGEIEHSIICENDVKGIEGTSYWADYAVPIKDEHGEITNFIQVSRDINELKKAEEALRTKTRLLERISDKMFDMVSLSDLEGRYTFVSKSHERNLGYTAEELIGKNVLDFLHPDDLPYIAERFKELLEKGGIDKANYRYKHKQDYYLWLETVGEVLLDENKAPVEVIFSTRDITDQINVKEELERIFSMSLDMICIADINTTKFLKINPAFTETLGFSEEQLLAKPFTEFIHPDDIDSTIAIVEKKLQAGEKVVNFNNRYRCSDGSYRWLSWVSHPDQQKGVTYAIARDITKEKQNEEKLLESKALLDATGNMARVGGWTLDAKTHEVTWTNATYRLHEVPIGYKPPLEEAINFFHPEDRPKLEKAIQRALDLGEPYDMEIRFTTAKGRDLWARTKCVPEMAGENVVKLKGTFQDITEIKIAENRLNELKRRNQALLDHSPVCHKIVDLDFNLQYMSANGFKMLKLDRNSEVYGKPYPFYFFPESFKKGMTKSLMEVRDTGKTITMEAQTNDIQGNEVWLDSALIPVFDGDNIEYITVVSADVTQRKRDEKERERLEGQLRQAQKMEAIGRLAGGVAHDFNNMLSVIIGYSEMAMEQLDPSQALYQNLEEVRNAGKRSANLTRQLLAFARKQTVAPKVLDLNETVTGMIRMLHRLIGEDIDLIFKAGENNWRVKIDPSQVDQILANLCVNARDAIDGVGKITIETGSAVFDEADCAGRPGFLPGEYVLLAVSDDGCGMSPDVLENIFDPFYSSKLSDKGTGLGLSTVYGVVKQNNGFINVYSEPGQGTTFRIYIPRHRTKKSQLPETNTAHPIERGNETILLVEDEPSILRMTAMMLEKLGYRVLKAKTPGEAIQTAHEYNHTIHLLLTDVIMPEMNGRELAKNVLSSHPNLKRLFMSGYTANVIAHHGVLDEGVNFIQKPFSREQLGAKVREALKGSE